MVKQAMKSYIRYTDSMRFAKDMILPGRCKSHLNLGQVMAKTALNQDYISNLLVFPVEASGTQRPELHAQ